MSDGKTVEDELRAFLSTSTTTSANGDSMSPSKKARPLSDDANADFDGESLLTKLAADDYKPNETIMSKTSSTDGDSFNWDAYLAETNSTAAPINCFYQSDTPPKNFFQEDKKLEVPDPRGPGCMCLATIQAVHGVWICVRLDGCDDSNDQWMICDHKDIHPVGYSSRTGGSLQPPVGFRPNHAQFHKFIDNQLRHNDDGSSPACPEEWFSPVDDKWLPLENKFQVGQKLEAMDARNFNGKLSPTTIVAIEGDTLTLNFDGWSFAYNVREKFDSRNLFPAGWAAKAGIDVQPPQKTKGKVKTTAGSAVKSTPEASGGRRKKELSVSSTSAPLPPSPSPRLSSEKRPKNDRMVTPTGAPLADRSGKKRGGGKLEEAVRKLAPAPSKESVGSSSDAADVSPTSPKKAKVEYGHADSSTKSSAAALKSSPIDNEDAPPQLTSQKSQASTAAAAAKSARARKTFTMSKAGAAKSEASVKADAPATAQAMKPKTIPATNAGKQLGKETASPAGVSPLGTPDIVLSPSDGVRKEDLQMMVYVNRNCACGPHLDADKLNEQLPPTFGPANVHHVVREMVQRLINVASDPRVVLRKVDAGNTRITSVTADVGGCTHVRALPLPRNAEMAWTFLNSLLAKLEACPNLLSRRRITCERCPPDDDDLSDAAAASASHSSRRSAGSSQKRKRAASSSDSDKSSTITEREAGGDPSPRTSGRSVEQWSVEEVAQSFGRLGDPHLPNLFRSHQIDGKALLLLSTDLILKHMQLPLGPALSITAHIEHLKSQA
uniref:SAM domain-containing protein n=1 Tax=Plectus sambesii TaxID=2011161 RepID=A0A914WJA1_9BILA